MSQLKPINLEVNSTPVTYDPNGFPMKDVSEYFDRSSGIPIGFPRIRIKVRRGNATMDSKVEVQVDLPTLADTSNSTATGIKPSATRAYNAIGKVEFILPRQSDESDRQALIDTVSQLLSKEVMQEAVAQLDFPY
nr:MAG: coat protein [Leviviridae sp.]